MYRVSSVYKSAMRADIREVPVYATIYFGLFDETAAPDATVTASQGTAYASAANVNTSSPPSVSYATFESNQLRLDGAQRLLPSTGMYERQGYISEVLSGADGIFAASPFVMIDFTKRHSIVGLTLTFDSAYSLPAQITVRAYRDGEETVSETISDGIEYVYRHEFLFEDVTRICIYFDRMSEEGMRARLNGVEFGIGYQYDDELIQSISEKHSGSPLSLKLPASSLEFELHNDDDRFSVESDTALQRFLAEGQVGVLSFKVGAQNIPSGEWYLSSWSVTGHTAKFSFKDAITRLNETTYEISDFDGKDHTLFDLAVDVLTDAGSEGYYIDPYLKTISTSAALPIGTHASCLQIVANAGGCQLSVNRKGRVSIVRLRNTGIKTTAKTNAPQTPYSDVATAIKPDNAIYGTFERDFARVDGTQIIVPSDRGYVDTGYTASGLSDAAGNCAENEVILEFDNPTNIFSVYVDWGSDTPPKKAKLSARVDGAWTDDTVIYPTTDSEKYSVSFYHCDAVRLEQLVAALAGQRARVRHISTSVISDFKLGKEQIFEGNTTALDTKLKAVTTQFYTMSTASETTSLKTTEADTNSGWIRLEHDLCLSPSVSVYNPNDKTEDGSVNVEAVHHAYVSYVRLTSDETKRVKVDFKGRKTEKIGNLITSGTVQRGLQGTDGGEYLSFNNPLFTSRSSAQKVADWVRDYYTNRVTYDYKVRGYPEIDLFDAIYLHDGSAAMINNIELSYNGALNQRLELRKGVV